MAECRCREASSHVASAVALLSRYHSARLELASIHLPNRVPETVPVSVKIPVTITVHTFFASAPRPTTLRAGERARSGALLPSDATGRRDTGRAGLWWHGTITRRPVLGGARTNQGASSRSRPFAFPEAGCGGFCAFVGRRIVS